MTINSSLPGMPDDGISTDASPPEWIPLVIRGAHAMQRIMLCVVGAYFAFGLVFGLSEPILVAASGIVFVGFWCMFVMSLRYRGLYGPVLTAPSWALATFMVIALAGGLRVAALQTDAGIAIFLCLVWLLCKHRPWKGRVQTYKHPAWRL